MSSIPNGLPTLSSGAHAPNQGKACFMEYASLLAGEAWSDSPSCTHPVIAEMARTVNDRLPDSRRHEIATLIPSVIGTADLREDETERRVLSVRLAVWCAKQVVDLSPDPQVSWVAIRAAEAWCDDPCEETRTAAAYATTAAADAAAAYAASAYAAYAAADAAAASAASAAYAAYAYAYAARAATSAQSAIDAAGLPGLLRGLIAEHARLTGHQPSPGVRTAWETADFTALTH